MQPYDKESYLQGIKTTREKKKQTPSKYEHYGFLFCFAFN